MDEFVWTVIGSAAGVVGAAAAVMFGLIPLLQGRRERKRERKKVPPAAGEPTAVAAGIDEVPVLLVGEIPQEPELAYRRAVAQLVRDSPDVLLRVASAPPLAEVTVRRGGDPASHPLSAADLALAEDDCWLIGGPGAGKSRQLSEWALRLCEGPGSVPSTPIPLLVRAADLLAYSSSPSGRPSPPARMLASSVNAALKAAGEAEIRWLEDFLSSQAPGDPPWLLLVDGLDEVPDAPSRSRVLRKLEDISTSRARRCRVVVASRPTGDAVPQEGGDRGETSGATLKTGGAGTDSARGWPSHRYELLGLSEPQRDRLLLDWFTELGEESPEQSVQAFTGEVARKGLKEVAQQPLMLVILAQLFVIDRAGSLPGTRVEAYDEIVGQVFEAFRKRVSGEAGPSSADGTAATAGASDWDVHRAVLERFADPSGLVSELAFARYWRQAGSAVDYFTARTEDLRRQAGLSPQRWALLIAELTPRAPLLVARGGDYDFVHATVYEYLAAKLIARYFRKSKWIRRFFWNGLPVGTDRGIEGLIQYLNSPESSAPGSFYEWLCAFWSDWPRFQKWLLQRLRWDRWQTCNSVAFLAWRRVPVASRVADAVRRRLAAEITPGPVRTAWKRIRSKAGYQDREQADHLVVAAATYLAMLGDSAGGEALARAAADPDIGDELRINAARLLTALGDGRGDDLYAAAVTAVIEAPIPFEQPERALQSLYGDEMLRRRRIALDFAQTGHPKAIQALRTFLNDDRFDSRTREYVYRMLAEAADRYPSCADICAALLAEFPAGNSPEESYGRSVAVGYIVKMTDPGSGDRLAVIARAATVASKHRLRAALTLAERGEEQAGDTLVDMLAQPLSDADRLSVAWALAGIGDARAVPELCALAGADAPRDDWMWQRQASAAAKSRESIEVLVALARALPAASRLGVIFVLCDIGDSRALDIAAEIGPDDPAGPAILFALADALARHAEPRFARLLSIWISRASTQDADEEAVKEWAIAVASKPAPILGIGLYAAMTRDEDLPLRIRWHALQDMLSLNHPQLIPCVLEMLPGLLEDTTGTIPGWFRDDIIDHLANHGMPEAVPYLVERIQDPRSYGRERAIEALTSIDGEAAATALVNVAPGLGTYEDSGLRYQVANRLIEIQHEKAVEVLSGWVDADRAAGDRPADWIVDRLVKLGAPHAAATLIDEDVTRKISFHDRLDPPSGWSAAIKALAGLGQPGADILARWTLDDSFTIDDRVEALLALQGRGDERAADLRDDLLASGPLNRSHLRRVTAAFKTGATD